jgi:hypothetical protein
MARALVLASVFSLVLFTGCNSAKEQSRHPASERERDSVLGASRLPGATGVRGALRVQDTAAAQNARLDSVASQH